MRTAVLMLRYSWRSLALALAVFLLGWHGYTVYSTLGGIREEVKVSVSQSAQMIDRALEDGDVVALRNVLGEILLDGVQSVRFEGERGTPLGLLARVVVGSPVTRAWGVRESSVNVAFSGARLGTVTCQIDLLQLSAQAVRGNGALYAAVALFMLVIAVFANAGALRTLSRVDKGLQEFAAAEGAAGLADLKRFLKEDSASVDLDPLTRSFIGLLTRHVEDVERAASVQAELAASRQLVALATQVAHDIRSPLAVLEASATGLSGASESTRVMVRRAVSHIRDIADDLLRRYEARASVGAAGGDLVPVMLAAEVVAVVEEKRIQYRDRSDVLIEASLDAASYGLFAAAQPTELRRVLSNLINNAVEALREPGGHVHVDLTARGGRTLIVVRDDGRGIPADVLARLGSRGATHGKVNGLGLGLAHARERAASWGGGLDLRSEVGKGTAATIWLPKAGAPAWFVREVPLDAGGPVVILDDDPSIHALWRARLSEAAPDVTIVDLYEPAELKAWVARDAGEARRARYLLDQHLAGFAETGAELAASAGIADRSVIVTSAHEDQALLERVAQLGCGLVPKSLARLVPLRARGVEPVDAVLVEDDELVRAVWRDAAKAHGKRLKVYARADDLLADIEALDRGAPIYVDFQVEEVRADALTRTLSDRGFKELYVATGRRATALPPMPWVKAVIGKDAPW